VSGRSALPRTSKDPTTLLAAGLGGIGAVMAATGTFADWFTIVIGGVAAPGGSATGWEGRDGRTVLAAAVVSAVAAGFVAFDTKRLAPKIALIVAGFVTAVIAVAGILDTRSKADKVQDEFAIAPERVSAEIGVGLWLVAGGGVVEVAGGILAPHPRGGFSRSLDRRAGGSAAAAAR
jgi:hypothetical protein